MTMGRYAEAEPLLNAALLRGASGCLARKMPTTLSSLHSLALLYKDQGRCAEAEPLCRRALDARERVLGKEHPDTLSTLNNLAQLYSAQGRHSEAEPLFRRVLEVRERVLGKEHPKHALTARTVSPCFTMTKAVTARPSRFTAAPSKSTSGCWAESIRIRS